jgi:hypothetical protein
LVFSSPHLSVLFKKIRAAHKKISFDEIYPYGHMGNMQRDEDEKKAKKRSERGGNFRREEERKRNR